MAGKKGCSGRKRTAKATKKARGTARADREKNEISVPDCDYPIAPDHLREDVQEEWNRLAPILAEAGLLTSADLLAFEMGMVAYSFWRETAERLRNESMLLTGESGQPYAHPMVWIEKANWERVLKFCTQFGLTPNARSGLDLTPAEEEKIDPLEAAFD